MTTMNISLPDEMKAFVEAQMARGGYASASEYLRALIRDDQRRQARRALETKLAEAIESGPAAPMTSEDWERLERNVRDRPRRPRPSQP